MHHLIDVLALDINGLQSVWVHIVSIGEFEDCLDLVDDPESPPGRPLPDVPRVEPAGLVYFTERPLVISVVTLRPGRFTRLAASDQLAWNTLVPFIQISPLLWLAKYSMSGQSTSLIKLQASGGPTWPGWRSPGRVRQQGAAHSVSP